MMNMVSVIVAVVVVAFIAILVVRKLIVDCSRSFKKKISSLDIPLIKEDISVLKTFMPLLCLDKEKVTRVLFKFAEAGDLEKLEHYMKIGVLRKVDINIQNEDGDYQTFGHVAVKMKNKYMFDWFLENGGRTDICGGKDEKTVNDILDEDSEVQMWRIVNKK